MNYFTFDGIDSRTYNTYIATSNAFDAPGREDEVIKVPGSNNIYYLTEGTYKPFDIKLYCYIPSNMQVKTDDLRNFLLSKGTCTYTEAIRPNEFRVARFIEAYELDVSDRVSAAFVLTFKAQPQRYLTTNTPITTTATADTTTDTTLSLSTVPTPITISLNGNTTQEGTPSPTNPQVIHNVSGDNTINVISKNLQPNECTPSTYIGITTENSGDMIHYFGTATGSGGRTAHKMKHVVLSRGAYSFSAHNISTNGTINLPDVVVQKVVGTTYTTIISRGMTTGGSFSLTEETEISIGFNCSSGTTYNCYFNIQLEHGTTQTTYEPYTRQSYPLNLGTIELNKIGTYQDYIYKNGGKWYVHKETYRLDLLSTYGYSMRTSGDIKYFTLSFGSTLPRSVNTFSGAFCNRFINGSTVTLGTFYITGTGSIFLCVPTDQTLASQLEFREWLSSNPTYAIIPLATATNTEITDTTLINQLNNIEKAYSYNGTTNILQVSNDNGFMLGVVSLHSNNVSSTYKGEPIITVNSTGLIYFNGCVIKVNQAPMTINSQTMQAYNGTVNLNNYIEANDFPMIEPGNNVIGSEMPLTIVPNYWKL